MCCTKTTPIRGNCSSLVYQGALNVHTRRKYLLQFYKTVVDDLLPVDMPHPLVGEEEDCKTEGHLDKSNAVRTRLFHKITETYTCTKVDG